MLTVVAALIESNGRLLVCQRRRGAAFQLMWEFPGGKVQSAESPAAALKRELREELGVSAEIGPEIYRTSHTYTEVTEPIELIFFTAIVSAGEIRNLIFEAIEWRKADTLAALDFLPADRELIEMLASGTLRMSTNWQRGRSKAAQGS